MAGIGGLIAQNEVFRNMLTGLMSTKIPRNTLSDNVFEPIDYVGEGLTSQYFRFVPRSAGNAYLSEINFGLDGTDVKSLPSALNNYSSDNFNAGLVDGDLGNFINVLDVNLDLNFTIPVTLTSIWLAPQRQNTTGPALFNAFADLDVYTSTDAIAYTLEQTIVISQSGGGSFANPSDTDTYLRGNLYTRFKINSETQDYLRET